MHGCSGLVARRRPTFPRLEAQYHGRWGVSRPSSGWDRVWQPRDGHRATGPERAGWVWIWCVCAVGCCVRRSPCGSGRGGGGLRIARAIRTARLSVLPRLHLRPIDVLVLHGPRRGPVLRLVSRLDAFSGYPFRTWLPGGAAGATTGAPEVRPSRSSRTRDSSSQASYTHGR